MGDETKNNNVNGQQPVRSQEEQDRIFWHFFNEKAAEYGLPTFQAEKPFEFAQLITVLLDDADTWVNHRRNMKNGVYDTPPPTSINEAYRRMHGVGSQLNALAIPALAGYADAFTYATHQLAIQAPVPEHVLKAPLPSLKARPQSSIPQNHYELRMKVLQKWEYVTESDEPITNTTIARWWGYRFRNAVMGITRTLAILDSIFSRRKHTTNYPQFLNPLNYLAFYLMAANGTRASAAVFDSFYQELTTFGPAKMFRDSLPDFSQIGHHKDFAGYKSAYSKTMGMPISDNIWLELRTLCWSIWASTKMMGPISNVVTNVWYKKLFWGFARGVHLIYVVGILGLHWLVTGQLGGAAYAGYRRLDDEGYLAPIQDTYNQGFIGNARAAFFNPYPFLLGDYIPSVRQLRNIFLPKKGVIFSEALVQETYTNICKSMPNKALRYISAQQEIDIKNLIRTIYQSDKKSAKEGIKILHKELLSLASHETFPTKVDRFLASLGADQDQQLAKFEAFVGKIARRTPLLSWVFQLIEENVEFNKETIDTTEQHIKAIEDKIAETYKRTETKKGITNLIPNMKKNLLNTLSRWRCEVQKTRARMQLYNLRSGGFLGHCRNFITAFYRGPKAVYQAMRTDMRYGVVSPIFMARTGLIFSSNFASFNAQMMIPGWSVAASGAYALGGWWPLAKYTLKKITSAAKNIITSKLGKIVLPLTIAGYTIYEFRDEIKYYLGLEDPYKHFFTYKNFDFFKNRNHLLNGYATRIESFVKLIFSGEEFNLDKILYPLDVIQQYQLLIATDDLTLTYLPISKYDLLLLFPGLLAKTIFVMPCRGINSKPTDELGIINDEPLFWLRTPEEVFNKVDGCRMNDWGLPVPKSQLPLFMKQLQMTFTLENQEENFNHAITILETFQNQILHLMHDVQRAQNHLDLLNKLQSYLSFVSQCPFLKPIVPELKSALAFCMKWQQAPAQGAFNIANNVAKIVDDITQSLLEPLEILEIKKAILAQFFHINGPIFLQFDPEKEHLKHLYTLPDSYQPNCYNNVQETLHVELPQRTSFSSMKKSTNPNQGHTSPVIREVIQFDDHFPHVIGNTILEPKNLFVFSKDAQGFTLSHKDIYTVLNKARRESQPFYFLDEHTSSFYTSPLISKDHRSFNKDNLFNELNKNDTFISIYHSATSMEALQFTVIKQINKNNPIIPFMCSFSLTTGQEASLFFTQTHAIISSKTHFSYTPLNIELEALNTLLLCHVNYQRQYFYQHIVKPEADKYLIAQLVAEHQHTQQIKQQTCFDHHAPQPKQTLYASIQAFKQLPKRKVFQHEIPNIQPDYNSKTSTAYVTTQQADHTPDLHNIGKQPQITTLESLATIDKAYTKAFNDNLEPFYKAELKFYIPLPETACPPSISKKTFDNYTNFIQPFLYQP